MRVHYLQHVPFEGLGSIEPTLSGANCQVSCTRLHQADELPQLDDFDLLIVLGGPMSVNDEARLPWLAREKALVRAAIDAGKRVLGVCLGAQLIASALGQRVYPNAQREIGWFPVRAVPSSADCFRFPKELEAFHWHGETFDLPADAVHLARSAACRNQAFQLGRNVIGLQFHLETTTESARDLVAHCGDEIVPSRYVQDAASIVHAPPEKFVAINAAMTKLLQYLLDAPGPAGS